MAEIDKGIGSRMAVSLNVVNLINWRIIWVHNCVRRLVAEQASREAARHEKYVNIFKRECTVKTFPKTRNDFNVLYVQLNLWKQSEVRTYTYLSIVFIASICSFILVKTDQ